MKRNKIVYIISFIDTALQYQWIASHYKNHSIFEVVYIILHHRDTVLENFYKENHLNYYFIYYRGKKDLVSAMLRIYKIIKSEQPEIVNLNLIDASISGIIPAYLNKVRHRIYSRHHSSFHHLYAKHAVLYDRLINKLSTRIVTATTANKKFIIEKESVPKDKVDVINYGFDLNYFKDISYDRIEAIRNKYNIRGAPVIGVMSRYVEYKGIQYIIPAFNKLLDLYPQGLLILANAGGPYTDRVKELLKSLSPNNYREISFENDSAALFKTFDIFVHVPVQYQAEAYGQVYVEALAAGIPSIFTFSGVANDFVVDKKNALVAEYRDSESIFNNMCEYLSNEDLKMRCIKNGYESVSGLFSVERMMSKWDDFYNSLISK